MPSLIRISNTAKRDEIAAFVENVLQIPFVNLDEIDINPDTIRQIPEDVCQKYDVFPFHRKKDHIAVAFSNPFDLDAEKEITYIAGKFVKTFFAHKDQIKRKIEEYYSPEKFIDNLVDRAKIEKAVEIGGQDGDGSDSSVVKLVGMIIGEAIEQEASDIHIEPQEKMVVVRYRVDGILRNILEIPKNVHPSLVSRIKIISDVNIAETRKPQDGKAKVIQDDSNIDLRISILPTSYGEKVVIRILDPRRALISFNQLGIRGQNLELLSKCFNRNQGMILVTGPTGSGKTTSLYAALNRIRNTTNNILTIEDPIEYRMDGISQVQVNEKAGITFASALRSFLRQDPDEILVGEMRDVETVTHALQAAETGQLILSTLHTNSAAESVDRIVDIFPAPQHQQIRTILANTLIGVISQRLAPMAFKNDRIAFMEILVNTPGVQNLIREGKSYQIPSAIQTGVEFGMQTFEKSFEKLRRNNLISPQLKLSQFV